MKRQYSQIGYTVFFFFLNNKFRDFSKTTLFLLPIVL